MAEGGIITLLAVRSRDSSGCYVLLRTVSIVRFLPGASLPIAQVILATGLTGLNVFRLLRTAC